MICCICHDKLKVEAVLGERISMCRLGVRLLNDTDMTVARATGILDEYLRERLADWDSIALANQDNYEQWKIDAACQRYEDYTKFENHFAAKRSGWISELIKGKYSNRLSPEQHLAVKVTRAFRHHLLRKNPQRNANYPKDWKIRAIKVRQRDDEMCRLCGETWAHGRIDLHVHHIIHKSKGGSHHPNNLVTLCHRHHNDEHPDQTFTAQAREPETLYPLPAAISTSTTEVTTFRADELLQQDACESDNVRTNAAKAPANNCNSFDQELPRSGRCDTELGSEMLQDGIVITIDYLESGKRKFNVYAEAMILDLGENIKPYLLSFYEGARNYPDMNTKGMSSTDQAMQAYATLMRSTVTASSPENSNHAIKPDTARFNSPQAIEPHGKSWKEAATNRHALTAIIISLAILLALYLFA